MKKSKKIISFMLIIILMIPVMSAIPTIQATNSVNVKFLVEPSLEFDYVSGFDGGLAEVVKNGKIGYIDKTGEIIIPLEYDMPGIGGEHLRHENENRGWIRNWNEDLTWVYVEKDGKHGFIDKTGKIVVPLEYDFVNGFSDGLAWVKKDDKYGYIDKTGKIVASLEYDRADNFNDGLAAVAKGNWRDGFKYGFIDKTGKIVVPLEYANVSNFKNGFAAVGKGNLTDVYKYGFIDKTGKIVVPLEYDSPYEQLYFFNDGFAAVNKSNKWGFVDMSSGNLSIPFEYDNIGIFVDGLAAVAKGNWTNGFKWGFIDKNGKIVVPLEYDIVSDFIEGLAFVAKGNLTDGYKYGFIDKTGKLILPLKYDGSSFFQEGLISVQINNKWGLIDKTGKVIVPLEYDYINHFCDNLALVYKGEYPNIKYGFVDMAGNVVVPLDYDNATSFNERLAVVEKNGKWGILEVTNENLTLEDNFLINVESSEVGSLIRLPVLPGNKGFNIYRSEKLEEKGELIAEKIGGKTFVDVNVEAKKTYYYTVEVILPDDSVVKSASFSVKIQDDLIISDIKGKKSFILMTIDDPEMSVDGIIQEIDPGRGTVPLIKDSRTLVPIRSIIETMGGSVGWDDAERKITLNAYDHDITMWLNKKEIIVDKKTKNMDVAPQSINDRTMLPVRFVTENIGCQIAWIGSTREVIIVFAR